jgi:hypothetical protein
VLTTGIGIDISGVSSIGKDKMDMMPNTAKPMMTMTADTRRFKISFVLCSN